MYVVLIAVSQLTISITPHEDKIAAMDQLESQFRRMRGKPRKNGPKLTAELWQLTPGTCGQLLFSMTTGEGKVIRTATLSGVAHAAVNVED